MQQLISTKFAYIEDSIKAMLEPLKSDQNFLRLINYLSDFPYQQSYYDDAQNLVLQPDIVMPYDLIGNGNILLTLFNPLIVKDAKVYIFFSHLHFNSNDTTALIEHNFVMDIVIPYENIQMGDQLRNIRICDEICRCIDNQSAIADVGRVSCNKGDSYIVNDIYEGIRLYFKADNRRFQA